MFVRVYIEIFLDRLYKTTQNIYICNIENRKQVTSIQFNIIDV